MKQGTKNGKEYELIGVFSFLLTCVSIHPDIYVRVSEYMPWIERNLENFVDPHVVLATFEDSRKPIKNDKDIVIMIASGVIILGCIFVVSLLICLIQQMIQFSNEKNSSLRNDDEINEVQLTDRENPSNGFVSPSHQTVENDTKEY